MLWKTLVTERISKLKLIHVSVMYQILWIHWIHWKFWSIEEKSNIYLIGKFYADDGIVLLCLDWPSHKMSNSKKHKRHYFKKMNVCITITFTFVSWKWMNFASDRIFAFCTNRRQNDKYHWSANFHATSFTFGFSRCECRIMLIHKIAVSVSATLKKNRLLLTTRSKKLKLWYIL